MRLSLVATLQVKTPRPKNRSLFKKRPKKRARSMIRKLTTLIRRIGLRMTRRIAYPRT